MNMRSDLFQMFRWYKFTINLIAPVYFFIQCGNGSKAGSKHHFLSEQEKKKRIPKFRQDSGTCCFDDVEMHNRMTDNRGDVAERRSYAVFAL